MGGAVTRGLHILFFFFFCSVLSAGPPRSGVLVCRPFPFKKIGRFWHRVCDVIVLDFFHYRLLLMGAFDALETNRDFCVRRGRLVAQRRVLLLKCSTLILRCVLAATAVVRRRALGRVVVEMPSMDEIFSSFLASFRFSS